MVFAIILWKDEGFGKLCVENTIQKEEVMARERKGFVYPKSTQERDNN
jgi:hypothetical protein